MSEAKAQQEQWERSPGYIYFIGADDPPAAIKIGISRQVDLRDRLATHQGSNHVPLRLIGVIPVEKGERPMKEAELQEARLHEKFDHLRRFKKFTPGGEWFNSAPDLLAFIHKHAAQPEALGLPVTVFVRGPGLES